MIHKHPEAVVKAIDFITYGCSGWACVAAYINHYSTLFKQKNYKLEKKKLEAMYGTDAKESN